VEIFEDEGESDDTRFGLPLTAFKLALKRRSTSISILESTDVLSFIKSQAK
jgi:DNA polymerase III sliding clamp (beta) subunit (PCNA family)